MKLNMKSISLKNLLLLTFIGFSILIISAVILSTNFLLENEFLSYIDHSQHQRVEEISEEIKSVYEENLELTPSLKATLDNYVLNGYIIEVYSSNNQLYNSFEENAEAISALRQAYAAQESEALQYFDDVYAVFINTFDTQEESLSIHLSMYRPLFIQQEGFTHLSSLNQIYLYVGGITFIIALVLGTLLTKLLLNPLRTLYRNIETIEQGDYNQDITSNSSILEYQQITNSFNNINLSLQKQKKARKNLSADLSHEFRTPLTAMKLTLENIEEGVWEFDSKILDSLLSEIGKMQLLVDDIHKLEQAESESLTMNKEIIDLKDLVNQSLVLLAPLIAEKNIQVDLQLNSMDIECDRYRIGQVITNVLSNGIKYNRDHGHLSIHGVSSDSTVTLSIKDTGIGISKDHLDYVFKRFYRSTSEKVQTQSGTGVGLAIAEEIMHAHNGKILAFSELDKGTEIILIFKK